MNKLKHTFWMVALVLGTLALSSCENDDNVGYDLQGIWQGDFAATNSYYGDADYSTLQFIHDTNDYTQGNGIETDYYGYYHYSDPHNFNWYVENGVIYMQFQNSGMDCQIRSYRLDDNGFWGTMRDRDGYDFDFALERVSY